MLLQGLVFVRGVITSQLSHFQLILMVISVVTWMYDDIKVLKILKEYSKQSYEIGMLIHSKQMITNENVNIDVQMTKNQNIINKHTVSSQMSMSPESLV